MTCGHCVMAVRRALEAVPGVRSVSVTLDPGEARVEYDDSTAAAEALAAAVGQAGYRAAVGG